MRPWEYWAMDAFEYALIQDLTSAFKDALEGERAAERKAAAMKGQG